MRLAFPLNSYPVAGWALSHSHFVGFTSSRAFRVQLLFFCTYRRCYSERFTGTGSDLFSYFCVVIQPFFSVMFFPHFADFSIWKEFKL